MSIKLNIQSPSKKELAQILRSIADLIASSSNKYVSVVGTVTFEKEKSKDC